MAFNSFADFCAMGGHGFYVWLSYGLMLGSGFALVLSSRQAHRRWLLQQRRQWQRQQAQQQQQAAHKAATFVHSVHQE